MNGRMRTDRQRGLFALTLAGLLAVSPFTALCAFAVEEISAAKEDIAKQNEDPAADAGEATETKEDFVISSAADWETFVSLAHTATWSQNRTVRLTADIVLQDETSRVVYFAGTFDGGGHTIDGVNIRAEISNAGLFEQTAASAVVHDLEVIGAVCPKGRPVTVGGIVGTNRGTLKNCSWFGSVEAHSEAGGIAGINEESGVIDGCSSGGIVQGDSQTGGIVGYNLGTVTDCGNVAQVNAVYTDVPFSTDDLTLTLDKILQTGRLVTPDNADQKTDIGGIAGFSVGTLARCNNSGRVGYEHVGFNVGGICGRSTGLIRNCTNDGEIFGRRETGGIVGQQQPDLSINFSEGKLGQISTALDDLQAMIDAALTDTEGYSNEASDLLAEISRLTGQAKGDVQTITNEATARADAEAARANETTGRVRQSASDLSDAAEDLSEVGGKVGDYAETEANARVDSTTIDPLLDDLETSYNAIQTALNAIQGTRGGGTEQFDTDIQEMKGIIQPIIYSIDADPTTEGDADYKVIKNGSDERNAGLTTSQLATLTSKLSAVQTRLKSYTDAPAGGNSRLQEDLNAIAGLNPADKAAIEAQIAAIRTQNATIAVKLQGLTDAGRSTLSLPSASDMKTTGALIKDAFNDVESAADRIAGIDLNVNSVSATTRAASSDLYSTIDKMIAEANALNASVRGATSGTVGNLKGINAQMGQLSDLIEEAVEEELNRSVDPADYTEDVSGEDFESATSGRTTGCRNNGTVHADGDAGGIAGIMGVDTQLNPDRDITTVTNRTTDATMLEKAIVDDCENNGRIISGGNYAGGITGRMQLGIIYGARDYGMIDSDGAYAGGIAGFSGAVVKNCLVKAHVRGQSYVGGIAGSGSTLTDNRAMVRIRDSVQSTGAIAGAAAEISAEKLSDNLWCGGEYRAIGDVDYAGLAQETDYAGITADTAGANAFKKLRLTFLADDEQVAEIPCDYGASIDADKLPAVPEKEGFFGVWAREDYRNITAEDRIDAVYTRVVTLIPSDLKREDGKPVFFAEGSFAPEDIITVEDKEDVYTLHLPAGQSESHVIRFLPSEEMKEVQIWLETDDGRTALETKTMGQYLTFEAPGNTFTLHVVKKPTILDRAKKHPVPVIGGAVLIAAAAGGGCAAGLRRRKKTELPEAEEEDGSDH
ncbi:MAG: hypothetical protein K6G16_00060 [Lachnospiraceae bacterium]|nr:hypothetical protein [Lachnospiraceae bacterium]